MYDICHPTYYNMSQLGCDDQVKLTTAFYVYMELCEVKRYWHVEYNYCSALQLFYIQAKKSRNADVDVFVPWPAVNSLTLDFISSIQHELVKEKFTFVFKEGDTTSVYYSVCSGIVKPATPEESHSLKLREDRKFELEREINRNTGNLYERALLLDDEAVSADKAKTDCSTDGTLRGHDGSDAAGSCLSPTPKDCPAAHSEDEDDSEALGDDNNSLPRHCDITDDVNNADRKRSCA